MDESVNGVVGYSMFDDSTLLDDSDSEGLGNTAFGSSNEEANVDEEAEAQNAEDEWLNNFAEQLQEDSGAPKFQVFTNTGRNKKISNESSRTIEGNFKSNASYVSPTFTDNLGVSDLASGHDDRKRENGSTLPVDTDVSRSIPEFRVRKSNESLSQPRSAREVHSQPRSAREVRGQSMDHSQITNPYGGLKPRRRVPALRKLRENEAIVEGQVSAARYLPETIVRAMVRVSYHSSSPASTSSHIHTLFRCRSSKHETESANCVSGGCQWVNRHFRFILPIEKIIHERDDGQIEFTLYHIRDNGVRRRVGSCALRMMTCLVPETEADLPLHTCLRWRAITAGTAYAQSELCVTARIVAKGDVRQRVQEYVLGLETGDRVEVPQHARQNATASARRKPPPASPPQDRRHLAHHSRTRKKHEVKEIRRQNRKLHSRISAHERHRRREPSTFTRNPMAVEGFLNAEEQRGRKQAKQRQVRRRQNKRIEKRLDGAKATLPPEVAEGKKIVKIGAQHKHPPRKPAPDPTKKLRRKVEKLKHSVLKEKKQNREVSLEVLQLQTQVEHLQKNILVKRRIVQELRRQRGRTAAAKAESSATKQALLAAVEAFFNTDLRSLQPLGVASVPALLQAFEGREKQLFARLLSLFGDVPDFDLTNAKLSKPVDDRPPLGDGWKSEVRLDMERDKDDAGNDDDAAGDDSDDDSDEDSDGDGEEEEDGEAQQEEYTRKILSLLEKRNKYRDATTEHKQRLASDQDALPMVLTQIRQLEVQVESAQLRRRWTAARRLRGTRDSFTAQEHASMSELDRLHAAVREQKVQRQLLEQRLKKITAKISAANGLAENAEEKDSSVDEEPKHSHPEGVRGENDTEGNHDVDDSREDGHTGNGHKDSVDIFASMCAKRQKKLDAVLARIEEKRRRQWDSDNRGEMPTLVSRVRQLGALWFQVQAGPFDEMRRRQQQEVAELTTISTLKDFESNPIRKKLRKIQAERSKSRLAVKDSNAQESPAKDDKSAHTSQQIYDTVNYDDGT